MVVISDNPKFLELQQSITAALDAAKLLKTNLDGSVGGKAVAAAAKKPLTPLVHPAYIPPSVQLPKPAPAVLSLIPAEQWQIQVVPYHDHGMLHFQLRPSPYGGYKTFNIKTGMSTLDALRDLIESSNYPTGTSWYNAGKKYLTCSILPGSSPFVQIPGLNIDLSSPDLTEIVGAATTVEAEEVESVVEEEDTDDDDYDNDDDYEEDNSDDDDF